MPNHISRIRDSLSKRFGETLTVDESLSGLDELARLAGRRVHRRYTERAVDPDMLRPDASPLDADVDYEGDGPLPPELIGNEDPAPGIP